MADPSPELAAQLRTLEASYAENPGRYFVPYAGLLREAGQSERAEEILRENVTRFPGLSARVLLGRCLADRGAYQEAANEFHFVLSIDAQNLIALRTLAEMATASGRASEARRWYTELLSVDPMNGDARAALARLAAETDAEEAPTEAASQAEPAFDEEWGNLDLGDATTSSATGDTEGDDGSDAGFDTFEFGEVDLSGDFRAEPTPALGEEERSGPGLLDADFPLLDFATEAEEEDGSPAPAEEDAESELLTETMAELYASQGLRDRAAEVYRELLRERGDDPALRRRLTDLEASAPAGMETSEAEPVHADAVGGAADGVAMDGEPVQAEWALPEAEPSPEPRVAAWEGAEGGAGIEPVPAARSAEDSFADSFATGFAEAGGEEDAGVAPAEPRLAGDDHPPASAEEAADLSADWAAAAAPLDEPAFPPAPEAEPAPRRTPRTMREYFAGLLAWTPGAGTGAAPTAEPEADPTPEPLASWEGTAASEPTEAVPEPETAPEPDAAPEPTGIEMGDVELDLELVDDQEPAVPEPWTAPEPATEERLPWELPAEPAPAEPASSGESGFSLDDFFAAEPESAPEPELPSPPPAPAPSTEGAAADPGEEDEDLESFQNWLQSLRR